MQNLRLISKKERKKMWSSERFFERNFRSKFSYSQINNPENSLFLRKNDPQPYKLDYIYKDFSINFLDFFLKKSKISFNKINNLNVGNFSRNKFIFPLDKFFFSFLKIVFCNFISSEKKLLNFKKLFTFYLKNFFLKLRKFRYNSRDLFYLL